MGKWETRPAFLKAPSRDPRTFFVGTNNGSKRHASAQAAGCWVLGAGRGALVSPGGPQVSPLRWGANARTDTSARGSGPPLQKSDRTGLQGPACELGKSCAGRRKSRGHGGWRMDGQTDRRTHSAQFHQFSRGRMLPTPSGTLIYFLFCPRPLSPLVNHRIHSSGHVLGSEHSLPPGGCARSHVLQT